MSLRDALILLTFYDDCNRIISTVKLKHAHDAVARSKVKLNTKFEFKTAISNNRKWLPIKDDTDIGGNSH